MNTVHVSDPTRYEVMTTAELRQAFLLEDLFKSGEIVLHYWYCDRAIVGSAVPTEHPLPLPCPKELASATFAERREIGIINIGGPGSVTVDERLFPLARLDCLYIGRGSKAVSFTSDNPAEPAQFYLVSYPAQHDYPTTLVAPAQAEKQELGSKEDANERTIHRCIHLAGIKSCQLVMGFTLLKPGSVWNTMPPHTHARRSEVYFYFDLKPNTAVVHLMGRPQATRNLVVHNRQAVLSPPWSIHAGVGTANYAFIWAMGGENQVFADMDAAPVDDLR
jgi:4-deoxy-L-threo-5-hexosulose-uronate ketol-isomerase